MTTRLTFKWWDSTTRQFVSDDWFGPIPRVGEGVTLVDHTHEVVAVFYEYQLGEIPAVQVQLSDRKAL